MRLLFIFGILCLIGYGAYKYYFNPQKLVEMAYSEIDNALPTASRSSSVRKGSTQDTHDGWISQYVRALDGKFKSKEFNTDTLYFNGISYDPEYDQVSYLVTPIKATDGWGEKEYEILARTIALYACAKVGNHGRAADFSETKVTLHGSSGRLYSWYFHKGFCPAED